MMLSRLLLLFHHFLHPCLKYVYAERVVPQRIDWRWQPRRWIPSSCKSKMSIAATPVKRYEHHTEHSTPHLRCPPYPTQSHSTPHQRGVYSSLVHPTSKYLLYIYLRKGPPRSRSFAQTMCRYLITNSSKKIYLIYTGHRHKQH